MVPVGWIFESIIPKEREIKEMYTRFIIPPIIYMSSRVLFLVFGDLQICYLAPTCITCHVYLVSWPLWRKFGIRRRKLKYLSYTYLAWL